MTSWSLRALLKPLDEDRIRALHERWQSPARSNGHGVPDGKRREMIARLQGWVEDRDRVQRRLQELPEKLAALLDAFLDEPGPARTARELFEDRQEVFRTRYEVAASLVALHREGFLYPVDGQPTAEAEYAVPGELAGSIGELRRRQRVEVGSALTLKGFLQERFFNTHKDDPERARDHARKVYKFYLMEPSIENRLRNLPAAVADVVGLALRRHGGIAPVAELRKVSPELDAELVRKCLEENLVGTVAPLALARFGLEPIEDAVVVFHEIALHRLTRLDAAEPPAVAETLCSGVDVVTNLGRLLREIASSRVQFTVEGELYKASARRIVKGFLDVPGGYLPGEAQIRFLYRYCVARRLVERSGERALRLSGAGAGAEDQGLHEKLRGLLGYAVEERLPQGEHYHQLRMRRILLRLLRRLECERWYEATFLAFLVRNTYLTRLEELGVAQLFAARFKGGGYVPTESVQKVCWLLLDFVKRRLYPLGLVDLGIRDGRPVALRLSRLGAEVLGEGGANDVGGQRSTLVVNPDFEIILFPGEDEHEAVHALDRFAERHKSDHIHHYHLRKETVVAALQDGIGIAQIVQELTDRGSAPLPQNVLFTLEDWAVFASAVVVGGDGEVTAPRPGPIDRFVGEPRLASFVAERTDATTLRLREGVDRQRLRELARDCGITVHVE